MEHSTGRHLLAHGVKVLQEDLLQGHRLHGLDAGAGFAKSRLMLAFLASCCDVLGRLLLLPCKRCSRKPRRRTACRKLLLNRMFYRASEPVDEL